MAVLISAVACAGAWAQRRPAGGQKSKAAAAKKEKAEAAAEDEGAGKAELDEIARLAPAERVERLRDFLKSPPDAASRLRAAELLTVARAALGDERLRASDRLAGVGLFREAVAGAPAGMSDKLFFEVVSQLPANLYLLGEQEEALELAREVERRAGASAPRLLSVAAFYLGVERAEEAARVAGGAVALQPDLAAAHQALGAAYRVGLRLGDAAASFRRALELDPQSANARRSLADLLRATGKPDEALALYRAQLEADPQDTSARTGMVLSLFDAGQRAEAERELEAALQLQASNLPLLVGASYWYAARGEGKRALELAERAVALEPRYRWVWARVAHARALRALNRPLEAERSLRAARELGGFPTLDYELASALAAAGLYDEAAEELSRSFAVRDGQVETERLAGRLSARAEGFGELLAPERRAGLFQFDGAETAAAERMLEALLALHQASSVEGGADAKTAAAAAREFAAGEDAMRAYRRLYAANRLARAGAGGRAAFEHAEAAIEGVEAALSSPLAPVALFADELREMRERARAAGETVAVPQVSRDRLSKVLRGRIEEAAGWGLYNEGQTAEAVVRLRRAVSVLPENTDWWRNAEWRLGAALEASGSQRDALAAYVRSYRLAPDPARRAVIESLYRRLNKDSAAGLEALLEEPGATAAAGPAAPLTQPAPAPTGTTPAATDAATAAAGATAVEATPANTVTEAPQPLTEPAPRQTSAPPDPSPSPASEPTPTPETAPPPETRPGRSAEPKTEPAPETQPSADPRPEPTATPSPEPDAAATSGQTPARNQPVTAGEPAPPAPAEADRPDRAARTEAGGRRRAGGGAGRCALVVGEESLTIKSNGGSATFSVSLDNYAGATPARLNPSTPHWADIIILAEPRSESDGAGARFTVASISSKTGAFAVTVNSPCGRRQVTVNVE